MTTISCTAKHPRPCNHSFSCRCLERRCTEKICSDVACSEGRRDFQIPRNSSGLQTVRTRVKETVSQYCAKHNERIRMYCFDCMVNMCSTCCVEAHRMHKFEKSDVVEEECISCIDYEIEQVMSRVKCFREAVEQTETEKSKLLGSVRATEQDIRDTGMRAKQLLTSVIDSKVNVLLEELQSLKSVAEKKVNSHRQALQLAVTEMDSLITDSLRLISRGSTAEITQAVNEIQDRAQKLLRCHAIPCKYHAPSYKFTSADIEQLLRQDHCFGNVVVSDAGNF